MLTQWLRPLNEWIYEFLCSGYKEKARIKQARGMEMNSLHCGSLRAVK